MAEARRLALPDFCSARSVLTVLLIVSLTALVISLSQDRSGLAFWTHLARTALFLVWIGLLGSALLCALRRPLAGLAAPAAAAIVLAGLAALVATVSEAAWQLELPEMEGTDHAMFLLRNVAVGLVVAGLALRYFYVSQQWRLNVESQSTLR